MQAGVCVIAVCGSLLIFINREAREGAGIKLPASNKLNVVANWVKCSEIRFFAKRQNASCHSNDTTKMKQLLTFLTISLLVTGCFIGAGTHGKIKSYKLPHSNDEIATIVDQFLLANPQYLETVEEDFGWIYIKIPPENNRFGFSIGGQSEIVLIAAGVENGKVEWDKDLSSSEKIRFGEIFKTHFIDKLTFPPRIEHILKKPFILSMNKDVDSDHYVFESDTLLSYPLPKEFDSLGMEYFEDLVVSFGKNNGHEVKINQFNNIFRIDNNYTGYVGDSIYITKQYRTIGQKKKTVVVFDTLDWSKYIDDSNRTKRIKDFVRLRKEKTDNGYSPTDIYSEFSEERWMINNKHLKRRTNGN